jgi:hypothetical protein
VLKPIRKQAAEACTFITTLFYSKKKLQVIILWMIQLAQQSVYVRGCMSSPGKEHGIFKRNLDSIKIYTEQLTMTSG